VDSGCGTGQATTVGNRSNKAQIWQIVIHGFAYNEHRLSILPIAKLLRGVFNGNLHIRHRE
jgi:hypothetical protein